jgi:hypothetical protein
MGLGAVADYQQHQKDKLQKQRFSDMISQAPFFEPGERELASNMMLAGQQDLAQQMFTSALTRSQKRAAQEAEMAGLPAQLQQIAAMGQKMPPGMSYSRPAPGGGNISFNPVEPPQPKEPKAPQQDEYTEEAGGFQYKIMREKGADGKWVVTDRTKIGPAPERGDKPDKPGAPTAADYRARALGQTTDKPKVDRLSPAQALDRLSPAEQEAIRKEIRSRAKTVPQQGAKGGPAAPAMSDAAARLAARFKIGQ